MSQISLICTDLDGTLFSDDLRPDQLLRFRGLCQQAFRRWRARWAIVTGRPLADMRPILMDFMTLGMVPDFLVLEDSLIHARNRRGRFSPFWWWNFNVRRRRARLFDRHTGIIRDWRAELMRHFPKAVNRGRKMIDLWLEFKDEKQAREAEGILRHMVHDSVHFYIFRWHNELCLAPKAGTKGEAIARLLRQLRIPRETVFAIGDGPNDLTMLDGTVAGMPACVANALPEIKDAVRQAGGFIAGKEAARGAIEALKFYLAKQD
jgi:hydroxymethylpyrimidine pyrophosphatase-like HAD family hydrolase